MTISKLQELEANISTAKEALELGSAIERLFSNRDFKKIVLNGYFEKEAVRLVHAKADVSNASEEAQKSIVLQIDSIGSFSKYLQRITTEAGLAGKTVELDEQTRDELIFEGLNNG